MAPQDTATEAEATDEGKNAIGAKYRDKYGKEGHNGDDIAVALKAHLVGEKNKIDVPLMIKCFEANGIEYAKYEHLNVGMQRMNLGNRLRGLFNKGTKVKIGKDTFFVEPKEDAAAA